MKNSEGATTPNASVLRVGVVDPVGSMDPRVLADGAAIVLARQIFETPFKATPSGDATPALFGAPLTELSDGEALRFRAPVNQRARFSDGTAITARALADALLSDPVFTSRASAEAEGDHVILTVSEADRRFDLFLTMCGLLFRESEGRLLGTGPYMLSDPPEPTVIRLVKNPHAWAEATIDTIEVRRYPADPHTGRPDALLTALERGEIDLAPRLSWRDIAFVKNAAAVTKPVNSTGILYMNNDRLKDPLLRSAMALAIDRTELAEVAFGQNPVAFRAVGLLPPALGKTPDGLIANSARARTEWLAAGGRSDALTLVYSPGPRPYLPAPALIARYVRDRIRRLGAEIETVETSSPELIARLNSGDFDLALMGNLPDGPDPSDFLSSVLASDSIPSKGGSSFAFNFSRYRNQEVDALIATYRKERQEETLKTIGRLLGRDVPMLPLLYGRTCVGHSWRVRGFQATQTGLVDLSALSVA